MSRRELMDLHLLIAGLLYPSEDDRPFEVVDWPPGPASARAAVARHVPAGTAMDAITVAAFFDPLRAGTDADRFAALERAVSGLARPAAVRVSDGSAQVRVFVVGRTPAGRWAGVQTSSVET